MLRPPRPGFIRSSVFVLGTVQSASCGSPQHGRLPQRGRLTWCAPLCLAAFFQQSGPFSPFLGRFPQRVSFPPRGSTWSAFLLSSVLNASFSSTWFSLAWFFPSAPTALFHSVCFLALWFSKQFSQCGTRGRSAWQSLWPPRGKYPRPEAEANPCRALTAPSSFRGLGSIFV